MSSIHLLPPPCVDIRQQCARSNEAASMDSRYQYEKEKEKEVEDETRGWITYISNLIRIPYDIAVSRTARRAYLTTFLFIILGLLLLGIAIIAYTLFYWSYIPRIGFERTIHLQFDNVYHTSDSRHDSAGNPYGLVTLAPDLVGAQRYDVLVELSLPRTPDNRDAGNFMLEAQIYAAGTVIDPVKNTILPGASDVDNRLALSRRPAIIPYRSWILEIIYRFTELHWYLLGWRSEADKLTISMWEGLEFARGWRNIPSSMRVDIQSTNRMQIYSAKALFRARFRGLRWLMYNHRILAAIVFITGFWVTEMIFAGLAWAGLSLYLQSPQSAAIKQESKAPRIKQEDLKADLSDTERTFPTTTTQPSLRYESPAIKQEDYDDDAAVLPPGTVSRATEADDENDDDDDADAFLDSGLGTSMESGPSRRESVRRRRGRARSEDEGK